MAFGVAAYCQPCQHPSMAEHLFEVHPVLGGYDVSHRLSLSDPYHSAPGGGPCTPDDGYKFLSDYAQVHAKRHDTFRVNGREFGEVERALAHVKSLLNPPPPPKRNVIAKKGRR